MFIVKDKAPKPKFASDKSFKDQLEIWLIKDNQKGIFLFCFVFSLLFIEFFYQL